MKKLLKVLGITIALTAIGVGVRARVRNEIKKENTRVINQLQMVSEAITRSKFDL